MSTKFTVSVFIPRSARTAPPAAHISATPADRRMSRSSGHSSHPAMEEEVTERVIPAVLFLGE